MRLTRLISRAFQQKVIKVDKISEEMSRILILFEEANIDVENKSRNFRKAIRLMKNMEVITNITISDILILILNALPVTKESSKNLNQNIWAYTLECKLYEPTWRIEPAPL